MLRIVSPLVLMIALLVAGCASFAPTNAPAATPTLPAIADEWTCKNDSFRRDHGIGAFH